MNALTAPVDLSVITVTPGQGYATKRLVPDAEGRPMTDKSRGLWIAGGRVQRVQVPGLTGLRDLLAGITKQQAVVHGVPHGSSPGDVFTLRTSTRYRGVPQTVARTLEQFAYPAPRALLLFDYDPEEAATVRVTTAAALMTHLAMLWPVMREVGYLRTYSTRSSIRAKDSPAPWLTAPSGMHVYALVTGDIARFRELLKVKLWCAGLGYCRLATANRDTGVAAILERALVDLTVFSPERLDYCAGAEIDPDAPFYQDRPAPELHDGIVLDLDALPAVTDAERQEYAQRLAAAKDRLRPPQRETVRAYLTAHAPDLPRAEHEQEITRRITQAEHGALAPEHRLHFPSGAITAERLTTRAGQPFDGRRLRDPQEPDYGPSQAVFHWRGGDWRIVSWAHGVRKVYRLAVQAPERPYHRPLSPLRLTLRGLATGLRRL
jgi:hypothetical protein